jgi:hypothetical protein
MQAKPTTIHSMHMADIVEKQTLIWRASSDWKPTILDLLEEIFTPDVLSELKLNPPDYFDWSDREWLQTALKAVGSNTTPEIFDTVVEEFISRYTHIRAFHACRPISVNTYYRNGLLPLNMEELRKLAESYFLSAESPPPHRHCLDRVMQELTNEGRKGLLYLLLDDWQFIRASHYLTYGSEALQGIAIALSRVTGKDWREILKEKGVPTVFVCDLPLYFIDSSTLHRTASQFVISTLCDLLQPKTELEIIDWSFTFDTVLPPNVIVSHYHPEWF